MMKSHACFLTNPFLLKNSNALFEVQFHGFELANEIFTHVAIQVIAGGREIIGSDKPVLQSDCLAIVFQCHGRQHKSLELLIAIGAAKGCVPALPVASIHSLCWV